MVFSSSLFIAYFLPVFLLLYYITPGKYKNYIILAASTFFYMWGAPRFVFVLFGSIALDFYLAHAIYNAPVERKRWYLILSVVLNTSILLYFKYANFFIGNVNAVLASLGYTEIAWVKVALPIGISFFTFHELSYIIDVYRGVKPPLKKITDYAVYILLFPQLVAGPIIRFNEISDQIQDRKNQLNTDSALIGFFRFGIGLGKKVLIANTLGAEADRIFALTQPELTFGLSWIGALCYTFQIYFDFSGYSDMAIGLARMMGFIFPENFNNPYISQSITEFWRRWHISLSRWMRDYLYIPLGGNQVTPLRMYMNLCLVFIISGFWHGAQWTFIIWGAYHGIFLILERLFLQNWLLRTIKPVRVLYSFLVVVFGWVLFRSDSLEQAMSFMKTMLVFDFHSLRFWLDVKVCTYLLLALGICFAPVFTKVELWEARVLTFQNTKMAIVSYVITGFVFIILSLGYISSSGFNPFIYFRF
jgi:alginate O-acetyltransferase complex protein AlgI